MSRTDLLLAALIITLPTIAASAQTSSTSRCDQLAAFYDRSAGRVDQGRTPAGRSERELGYQDCQRGKVDTGVQLLEEAIRKAGYQVPAA